MPSASPASDSTYQVLDVVVESLGSDLDGLAPWKRLQWLWQLLDGGQPGVADEDRSDDGTTGEAGGHLAPHPILRVVESTTTILFGCHPVGPNDGEKDITSSESVG